MPPQHYLPERLGVPQLVARIGIGNLDSDLYALADEPFATETKAAFFAKGGTVGRQTVVEARRMLQANF